ncbi:MAG: thermonuclease family protein [Candidatus Krumholzibacteria bacterium]|nr:thermonuclease family protein [Candidatus Krumholzibacteria bacterium]MDH4336589.1 thermonuclease family protein [Candidatus Krumholzibacteria bacterium]MDH5270191.1 thermonuclease family protein [Candidatus Krumholzibacteria bacterium]MDH5628237.1 thermonuclease family protein [Candidatus Krumholzibacteria bacterium]
MNLTWRTRGGLAAGILAVLLPATGCRDSGRETRAPSYPGATVVDVAHIQFDDGDTFYIDGAPIRFLGIDTPETADPGVGIFEDQPFGPAAAESTRVLVLRASVVEMATDGRDRYNRRLAHIFIDGDLLAERLLAMGLAYETISHFGDNGFPDLADRILRAAEAGPRPAFEEPYKWRKKHQRREAAAKE